MSNTFSQIEQAEKNAKQIIEQAKQEAESIKQNAITKGKNMLANTQDSIANDLELLISDADRTIKGFQENAKKQYKKEQDALTKISAEKTTKAKNIILKALNNYNFS